MKKALLALSVLASATFLQAQQLTRNCGTGVPGAAWDSWFNQQVEDYKHSLQTGKATSASFTIGVIVHVIHGGEAMGTYPNLSQAQINSQIDVLNQDHGGTGYNSGNYPANAFSSYATASSLPAPNTNSVVIANTGITFVLATRDSLGNPLAEPGIDRINYNTMGWSNPATYSTSSTLQSFITNTVKPATIWNPYKYLNIWISDENASTGLTGFSTFPGGTSLSGLTSGLGTISTFGTWIYAKAFGSVNICPGGSYAAPFSYGRTATHEIGHCLGLRHIWGDGSCLTDYCNDTPPAAAANYGIPTYPYHSGTCTGNSPNGEMFMNFLDYTDDAGMYMFTTDQATRMQTAMQTATFLSNLTNASATVCAPVTVVASFNLSAAGICLGNSVSATSTSTGSPTNYLWKVSPMTGVSIGTPTATSTSIGFSTPGNYSVSLVASNTGSADSTTQLLTVSASPTVTATLTHDTVCMGSDDTLNLSISGGTAPFSYSIPALSISGSAMPIILNSLTSTTTFSVMVTDQYGCSGASTSTTVVVNTPDSISGTVIDTAGALVTAGQVYLFRAQATNPGTGDTVAITSIASGKYTFPTVPLGDYVIKVIADSNVYPTAVGTYHSYKQYPYQWDSALTVMHTWCYNDNDTGYNVRLVEINSTGGPGGVGGNIGSGPGYGHRYIGGTQVMGAPLKGIDIKLGRTNGQPVARTTTNVGGNYSFTNLPLGVYNVYVDVPNYPMQSILTVTLTSMNPMSINNDYEIDSVNIYPVLHTTTVGLNKIGAARIYPNPGTGVLQIESGVAQSELAILNMLGETVASVQLYGEKTTADLSHLGNGVYYYELSSNKALLSGGKLVIAK